MARGSGGARRRVGSGGARKGCGSHHRRRRHHAHRSRTPRPLGGRVSDWDDTGIAAPRAARPAVARGGGANRPRRGRRYLRMAGALVAVAILVVSPWWGRAVLSRMSFFQLRKVEIEGLRYLQPAEVAARMKVDTSLSIWIDLDPVAARVLAHPQVADVRLRRRLPGTLVARVTEHLPVAMLPTRSGFSVLDARGVILPMDPTRTAVNLPVVAQRD